MNFLHTNDAALCDNCLSIIHYDTDSYNFGLRGEVFCERCASPINQRRDWDDDHYDAYAETWSDALTFYAVLTVVAIAWLITFAFLLDLTR